MWSLPLDRFPPSASSEPLQKTKAAVKGWISTLALASSLMSQRQQCLKRSKEIHCCNFFCIMDIQGWVLKGREAELFRSYLQYNFLLMLYRIPPHPVFLPGSNSAMGKGTDFEMQRNHAFFKALSFDQHFNVRCTQSCCQPCESSEGAESRCGKHPTLRTLRSLSWTYLRGDI